MRPRSLSHWRLAALVFFPAFLGSSAARAEVTRIEIQSREDVLAGKTWGAAGVYEKLSGRVYFAVDPSVPANRRIADLDKAPRNARGLVEFSSDLAILKPKDPKSGNGVVLFDVVNRGARSLLAVFSRGARGGDFTTEAEFGDGSLLHQGYTLVAVGWQFDVPKGGNRLGIDVPVATDRGRAITGWVRMSFTSPQAVAAFEYVAGNNTRAYPPLDLENSAYRL
ncbi:MAG: hypothetical protein ABI972_19975, partial [Acidobacteriota bacterium]